MSQPSASNVLLALGPGKAKPGLGLVTWETDPEDARKQRFTLTEKGRDLVSRVTAHLHGQAAD
jgi:hypothetical protein